MTETSCRSLWKSNFSSTFALIIVIVAKRNGHFNGHSIQCCSANCMNSSNRIDDSHAFSIVCRFAVPVFSLLLHGCEFKTFFTMMWRRYRLHVCVDGSPLEMLLQCWPGVLFLTFACNCIVCSVATFVLMLSSAFQVIRWHREDICECVWCATTTTTAAEKKQFRGGKRMENANDEKTRENLISALTKLENQKMQRPIGDASSFWFRLLHLWMSIYK